MNSISRFIENSFDLSVENLIEIIESEKKNKVKRHLLSKRGKDRAVYEVDKNTYLYRLQSMLLKYFSSKFYFPDFVFGFQKQKSYYDFLYEHTTQNIKTCFLKLDIQDFFMSINSKKLVMDLVDYYEEDQNKKEKILKLFLLSLTYENMIPQGFKTSPFLSNYYFFIADLRIKKFCNKMNIIYSRYADDMIFSSDDKKKIYSNRTIKVIEEILNDFSLKINRSKTKLSETEFVLNGYVIKGEVKLSINRMKELKRILYIIETASSKKDFKVETNKIEVLLDLINENTYLCSKKMPLSRTFNKEYLMNYLSGYRSFLISFIKKNKSDQQWSQFARKTIIRIEKALLILYG